MRIAPNGNIDPERQFPSMFEPVHGTVPDIAGTRKSNPLAAIVSGSMMPRHPGENGTADSADNEALKIVEFGETLAPIWEAHPPPNRQAMPLCRLLVSINKK